MNVWFMSCFVLAVLFVLLALIFTLVGEKGVILISGFNTMSKEEKEQYDKKRIVIDQRSELLVWSVILLIGSVLTYFISWVWAPISLIVWLIVFFSNVHIDAYKAFEKYKK